MPWLRARTDWAVLVQRKGQRARAFQVERKDVWSVEKQTTQARSRRSRSSLTAGAGTVDGFGREDRLTVQQVAGSVAAWAPAAKQ